MQEAIDIAYTATFHQPVCAHVIAFGGDIQVCLFLGNRSDCKADYRERYGKSAEVPQRIKYQTLKR